MSKKLCKKNDGLEVKLADKKMKYVCARCEGQSPKDKWLCKPRKIKR